MSDEQELKDSVETYRKANKDLDDKLNTAVENLQRRRKEQEERQNR